MTFPKRTATPPQVILLVRDVLMASRDIGIGRVVHSTPGRLRLRVERARRSPAVYDELRGLLGMLPGVTDLEITPSTGSVLVSYEPNTLDVAHLLRLGAELGWISPNGKGIASRSHAADWRSYVDVPRARRALAFLGVAGLGALVGPVVGVGSRVGSIGASVGYLALTRWAKSVRQK